jgi:hypothetical protein
MDFWVLLSEALEGNSAEEAKLAVGEGMDRCGPWQPIDHSEIADDCTRSYDRNYALSDLRRYQTDLEQTFVEPIAPVALVADQEKRVAGLPLTERRPSKQLRRNFVGQAGPCAADRQFHHKP